MRLAVLISVVLRPRRARRRARPLMGHHEAMRWGLALLVVLVGCRKRPRHGAAAPDAGAQHAVDAAVDAARPPPDGALPDAELEADAALPGVIVGQTALGPFDAPAKLCDALLADIAPDRRDFTSCQADAKGPRADVGPYQAPQPWTFQDDDENFTRYLVFRWGGQWFAADAGSWDTMNTSNGDVTVGKLAARDVVPGGTPELVFDVVSLSSDMDDFDNQRFDEVTERAVCGIGPSGRPSCAAVTLGGRGDDDSPFTDVKRYRYALDCPFLPDGRIACKVRGKWPDSAPDRGELEQTFTLVFS